jgi:AcrR family transcriptional regulator
MVNIMTGFVDSVNMTPPTRSYHHGDLRNAMIEAAVAAARRDGPSAVVVRDIARQVGVSHNAGYRHFSGRDDLLGAVAVVGLGELAHRMRAGLDAAPRHRDKVRQARSRLRAIGQAYIAFATSEPGLFRSVWAGTGGPPEYLADAPPAAESDPYQLLGSVLDEMVAAGAMPAVRRPNSEIVAWAAVHGLSMLMLDGPLASLPPDELQLAIERVCDVIEAGL